MKTKILVSGILITLVMMSFSNMMAQWTSSGTNIYNTNSGNAGIGTSSPGTLLYVTRNMSEPTITIRNPGGFGGATFSMIDNASGANWKFKATLTGGFKVRDNANALDVIVFEPNSFANAIYISNNGSIGIGTSAPVSSSILQMNSTTQGFLVPRLNQGQINGITSPADGLLVYNTTAQKLYIYSAAAGGWLENAFGTNTILPPLPFTCGNILTVNHVAGSVAPVTKTVPYGTVVSNLAGSNKCWITQNLGSSQQAVAVNDATEPSAGWYWQFNRQQGYRHDGVARTPSTVWIDPITEQTDWQAANDPCAIELGGAWRIPTYNEWNNARASGGWIDWNGPWNSALKLHAAGALHTSGGGNLVFRGVFGDYWSSSQGNDSDGGLLEFGNANATMFSYSKAFGFSVRCIEDTPPPSFSCGLPIIKNHIAGNVAPVTKTVIYSTATGIAGEPGKCWIIQNLGADQQATAVNDATEPSAGWYWQFNRMQGYKHDGVLLTPSWTITSIWENFEWEAQNDPCAIELGFGWHVPTSTEWTNVDAAGGWIDWNGPWNSALKIHAAGYLNSSNGILYDRAVSGYYWSRNQNQFQNFDGFQLYFFNVLCNVQTLNKAVGHSVRCVR